MTYFCTTQHFHHLTKFCSTKYQIQLIVTEKRVPNYACILLSLSHTHMHTLTHVNTRDLELFCISSRTGIPLFGITFPSSAPEDKDAQGRATQTCAHPSSPRQSAPELPASYCEYPGPQKMFAIQTVSLRERME